MIKIVLLLTLTHVAHAAQCPATDGITFMDNYGSSCECGSSTCYSDTGDWFCKASINQCSSNPTCSNLDATMTLVKPDSRDYCQCGTARCDFQEGTSAFGITHEYCNEKKNQCHFELCGANDTALFNNINNTKCTCGTETCDPAQGNNTVCKSATMTCEAPCSDTSGLFSNQGLISYDWTSCKCGSNSCVRYSNDYCQASSSTCSNGKICSNVDGTQLLVKPDGDGFCTCGTTSCSFQRSSIQQSRPSPNDEYCNKTANNGNGQCMAPCSETDGVSEINFPSYNSQMYSQCTCGSSTCYNIKNERYCKASSSTCGTGKVYPACAKDTTLSNNCDCGGSNGYFGRSTCGSGEICEAATNTCSYPQCGNTDATAKNSNSCKCGGTHCSSSDYSDNGFYCNKASNICGVSTDILKYARTVPTGESSGSGSGSNQLYSKCSDIPGNNIIMDEVECFEVFAAIAPDAPMEVQQRTDSPAGCQLPKKGYQRFSGYFNGAPKQFTTDETTAGMVCLIGTSLSEADKISKLETTQNTCCAKNAELEARLELLEKKYEEINEVCKTKSSDGRRLATAAGCGGGASMSNTNTNTPDGLGPGAIAAIVIVPIVVLLGCAGAYMYVQRQQSEKKNPEKVYELKHFTPKDATAELFDQRGSMNSNNPLADAGLVQENELQIASGTNPMIPQNELQIASGTNPMAHVPRQQQQQQQQQQQEGELQVDIGSTTEELPLPLNWEKINGANDDGPCYYWNTETDVTQYERPL